MSGCEIDQEVGAANLVTRTGDSADLSLSDIGINGMIVSASWRIGKLQLPKVPSTFVRFNTGVAVLSFTAADAPAHA